MNDSGFKGLIFNSQTVERLTGDLTAAIRELNVKTAVVTNHGKTETLEKLDRLGITVDVVVGKFDLNRYGQICKPMPDQVFVAMAQMGLEADDVALITTTDNDVDQTVASEAGTFCGFSDNMSDEAFIQVLGYNEEPQVVERDFSSFEVPVTGLMGAIVGDTLGSRYEHHRTTDCNFELFPSRSHPTDDSIGTLAVASWLLGDRSRESLVKTMSRMVNLHPKAGWSHRFRHWARTANHRPYGAVTNGSAMRCSACGIVAGSLDEALDLAKRSAEISHNSVEGIHGAQAVCACIFLAKTGHPKAEIKKYIEDTFGYDLDTTVSEHRRRGIHEYTCNVSVPQAIRCWLENDTYESAVRNAIAVGYDADTIGAICGSICASTPGMEIPQAWADRTFNLMKQDLRDILYDFETAVCTD